MSHPSPVTTPFPCFEVRAHLILVLAKSCRLYTLQSSTANEYASAAGVGTCAPSPISDSDSDFQIFGLAIV
eukprot:1248311-Rhodomonas_salina.1